MPITRYYSPSSLVMGPLAYLAGFGQEKADVERVEAQMKARENEQLYGGLGQGLGNLVSSYSNIKAKSHFDNVEHKNRLGLMEQQQANYLALDRARTQNNIQEMASQQAIETGIPYDLVSSVLSGGGGGSFMPSSPTSYDFQPDPYMRDDMGQAIGSLAQPQQPPPGMTEEMVPEGFKRAMSPQQSNHYSRLEDRKRHIMTSQTMNPQERYAELLQINQEQDFLRRNPSLIPDPPKPMMTGPNGQLVPMQLGQNFTYGPDGKPDGGMLLWGGGDDFKHVAPTKDAEERMKNYVYTDSTSGESMPLVPGLNKFADGSVAVVDKDGVTYTPPNEQAEDRSYKEFTTLYSNLSKNMTKKNQLGVEVAPSHEEVMKSINNMNEAWENVQTQKEHESPAGQEKTQRVLSVTSQAISAFNSGAGGADDLGQALSVLKKEYPDPTKMPSEVARDFIHIRDLLEIAAKELRKQKEKEEKKAAKSIPAPLRGISPGPVPEARWNYPARGDY